MPLALPFSSDPRLAPPQGLAQSMAALEAELVQTTSLAEAFRIYQWLAQIERDVHGLTNQAAMRCEQLLEAL